MSGRPSYRSGPYDRSSSRGRSKTRHIRSKQPPRTKRPEVTNRLLLQSLRPHQQIGIEYERTPGNSDMFEVRVQMGRVSAVLQGAEKGVILEMACGVVIEKMMVEAEERNEDMGKFASYCTRKVLMDAKKKFVNKRMPVIALFNKQHPGKRVQFEMRGTKWRAHIIIQNKQYSAEGEDKHSLLEGVLAHVLIDTQMLGEKSCDIKYPVQVIAQVGPSSTTQTPNSSENSAMDVEDKET